MTLTSITPESNETKYQRALNGTLYQRQSMTLTSVTSNRFSSKAKPKRICGALQPIYLFELIKLLSFGKYKRLTYAYAAFLLGISEDQFGRLKKIAIDLKLILSEQYLGPQEIDPRTGRPYLHQSQACWVTVTKTGLSYFREQESFLAPFPAKKLPRSAIILYPPSDQTTPQLTKKRTPQAHPHYVMSSIFKGDIRIILRENATKQRSQLTKVTKLTELADQIKEINQLPFIFEEDKILKVKELESQPIEQETIPYDPHLEDACKTYGFCMARKMLVHVKVLTWKVFSDAWDCMMQYGPPIDCTRAFLHKACSREDKPNPISNTERARKVMEEAIENDNSFSIQKHPVTRNDLACKTFYDGTQKWIPLNIDFDIFMHIMFDKDLSFSSSNIRNGIRPNIDVNKDRLAYHMKKDKRYSITYDCGFEKLIAHKDFGEENSKFCDMQAPPWHFKGKLFDDTSDEPITRDEADSLLNSIDEYETVDPIAEMRENFMKSQAEAEVSKIAMQIELDKIKSMFGHIALTPAC